MYVRVSVCVCVFVRACAQVNADSTAAETLESLRKTKKDEALFIMGFELLDNMPHDKVFCFFHFILIQHSFRLKACVGRLQSLLQLISLEFSDRYAMAHYAANMNQHTNNQFYKIESRPSR